MPYCEYCGEKYEKTEETCSKCGRKLNVVLLDAKRAEIERRKMMKEAKKRRIVGSSDYHTGRGKDLPQISPEELRNAKKASLFDRAVAKVVDTLLVGIIPNLLLPIIGGFVAGALYYVNFYISRGQTLGMILVGSKVVSADGYPITVEQAFKRYLTFSFLSGLLTLGIGYLMYLFNPERQTLHDRIANTYVISLHDSLSEMTEDGRGMDR
jgi:hypothetical protein